MAIQGGRIVGRIYHSSKPVVSDLGVVKRTERSSRVPPVSSPVSCTITLPRSLRHSSSLSVLRRLSCSEGIPHGERRPMSLARSQYASRPKKQAFQQPGKKLKMTRPMGSGSRPASVDNEQRQDARSPSERVRCIPEIRRFRSSGRMDVTDVDLSLVSVAPTPTTGSSGRNLSEYTQVLETLHPELSHSKIPHSNNSVEVTPHCPCSICSP